MNLILRFQLIKLEFFQGIQILRQIYQVLWRSWDIIAKLSIWYFDKSKYFDTDKRENIEESVKISREHLISGFLTFKFMRQTKGDFATC